MLIDANISKVEALLQQLISSPFPDAELPPDLVEVLINNDLRVSDAYKVVSDPHEASVEDENDSFFAPDSDIALAGSLSSKL